MFRHTCSTLGSMLIALGLALGARPMQGQTMSFFRQFTTPGVDQATAVATDASGIYVLGSRYDYPFYYFSESRAGVRKYDAQGNELWTREISGPAPGFVAPLRVLADTTGIYVLGQYFLRKYSTGGDELWTRHLEFYHVDAAVDATGVYVAGGDSPPNAPYLRKYSPDGAELWTSRFGDRILFFPISVAVDPTGVYVFETEARFTTTSTIYTSFARKFDLRGNELWTRQLYTSHPELIRVAAAYPTGFYVVATEGGPSGTFLRKYDSAGNELWSRPVAKPGPAVSGVAADATGVYLVDGTSLAALPGQCRSGSGGDSVVRKYDPDGAEQWTRQFGTADGSSTSGVAVDDSGVYVVGQYGTAMSLDYSGLFADLETANPAGAYLAKFEKSPAVVTGSRPRIFPDCVVNAASYVGGGVPPGEIVTIFGSAMGPSELAPLRLTDDRRLATNLADTRILFNGVPAPLVYVSDKQSSAIVPYAVAGRPSVDVQVEYKGVRSDVMTVPVLASRPGIFSLDGSGHGHGAIRNEDGSLNSPSNPAQRGSIISIFGTGGGEAAPGVVDGQIVSNVLPRTSLPVSVLFVGLSDAKQGEVLYAGGSPGSVAGLLQVNVRVPPNAAVGNEVPLALIIGSHSESFQVTIALR